VETVLPQKEEKYDLWYDEWKEIREELKGL
jgi:hypothetical protein